jgi:hypothetical protein
VVQAQPYRLVIDNPQAFEKDDGRSGGQVQLSGDNLTGGTHVEAEQTGIGTSTLVQDGFGESGPPLKGGGLTAAADKRAPSLRRFNDPLLLEVR